MFPGPLFPLSYAYALQTLDIRSRHGLITEAALQIDASQLGSVLGGELDMWAKSSLVGQRYGPLVPESSESGDSAIAHTPEIRDIATWLETAFDMSK